MNKIKTILRWLTITFLSGLFLCIEASAQATPGARTVLVTGEAVVYDGNVAQAKNMALQEAFASAIRQVMGTYVTAQSFSQNFVNIDRSVLNRTQGYIKTYKILETNETPDFVMLKIEAIVAEDGIKNDLAALGILLDSMGNPVVAVQGKDQGLEISGSLPVFKQRLAEKGFYLKEAHPDKTPDVNIQLQGAVANQTQISSTGMFGAVVNLRAQAQQVSTQKLIASQSVLANGAGFDETAALTQAYQNAADQLAPQLVEAISKTWQSALTAGRTIQLKAIAPDYAAIQQFTRYLGRTFGVKKVDLKFFDAGIGHFLIRFTGPTRTLADLLIKDPPDDLALQVKNFSADAMEVAMEKLQK